MAIKNLASGTLAESVSASATTLLVYVGNGSASTIKGVWPDTPFYATIMPASPSAGVPNSLDSEIVEVTAVGNDQVGNTALTVVRGQKNTTAKAFAADAVVTNANYADDSIGTDRIEDGAVTTAKIAASAVTESKIDMAGMPGLVAQGWIFSDDISNNFTIGLFSSTRVYDSRYAASSGIEILLLPGDYIILMYSRWSDGDGSRYAGFTYDNDTTDTIDRGSWCYSSNRITQEITRVLHLTSAKSLQLLFYDDTDTRPGSVSGSLFVFRINKADK